MIKKFILLLILVLIPIVFFVAPNEVFRSELEKEIKQIDDDFSGNLGVYIKDMGNGSTVNYNSNRKWYLASTIKIPVAIAILQKIEDGELSLDDKITMRESDLVDGNGDMIWQPTGTSYTIRELLVRMIKESDSIAADMLIRLLGEDYLNEHIHDRIISDGVERITTILQVRYDAYSELHEKAANLTNKDIIKLKGITPMSNRLDELLRIISVDKSELKAKTIPDAFERYYEREINCAEPRAMGLMLERLAGKDYLNDEHTDLLLEIMKSVSTGDRRIKAGLPKGTIFAHKTGTQIARAANMGIIYSPNDEHPIIVVVCAEKYNDLREAESAFKKIGHLISENWLE